VLLKSDFDVKKLEASFYHLRQTYVAHQSKQNVWNKLGYTVWCYLSLTLMFKKPAPAFSFFLYKWDNFEAKQKKVSKQKLQFHFSFKVKNSFNIWFEKRSFLSHSSSQMMKKNVNFLKQGWHYRDLHFCLWDRMVIKSFYKNLIISTLK
jgi:hypothetical protein